MAFDAFLKIDGIPGESRDSKHKDWIDVLSFSWGISQPSRATGSGGAAAERAQVFDFCFNHLLDKSSPKLMLSCANGSHIKDATFELVYQGGPSLTFYQLKMTEVIISSVKPSGTTSVDSGLTEEGVPVQTGPSKPPEDVALNFGKIEWKYWPTKPGGSLDTPISGWFDLRLNKTA